MSELREKAKVRITELRKQLEAAKKERDQAGVDLSRIRRETVDARRTIADERRRATEAADAARKEGAGALEQERQKLQRQLDELRASADSDTKRASEKWAGDRAALDQRLADAAAQRAREAQDAHDLRLRQAAELIAALEASETARGYAGVVQAGLRQQLRAEQETGLELRERLAALTSSGENVPKEALDGAERRLADSESRRKQLQEDLDKQAGLAKAAQRERDAAEKRSKEAAREAEEAKDAAAEARRLAASARQEAGRSASRLAGSVAAAQGNADAAAADKAADRAGHEAAEAAREREPEAPAMAGSAAGIVGAAP